MNNQLIREHTHKDDTPNDKIDPDFVRIVKLEEIVESWFNFYDRYRTHFGNKKAIRESLASCFDRINIESHSEKYTTEEIKDALCGHFIYDDIIIFLLKPYMENL